MFDQIENKYSAVNFEILVLTFCVLTSSAQDRCSI